jgi:hypothetical protein
MTESGNFDPNDRHRVDVRLRQEDAPAVALLSRPTSSRDAWIEGMAGWLPYITVGLVVLVAFIEPLAWIAVAAGTASLVALSQVSRRRFTNGLAVLSGVYEVQLEGLVKKSSFGTTLVDWATIEFVGRTGAHTLIRFAGTGWVIPDRCFESDDHRRGLLAAVSELAEIRPM